MEQPRFETTITFAAIPESGILVSPKSFPPGTPVLLIEESMALSVLGRVDRAVEAMLKGE